MGYKQSTRSGGKWIGEYEVLHYDDISSAKSCKSLTLRTVRKSELIVPQFVDKGAPLIFPLVENIIRFPFENKLTLSQQDGDVKKRVASKDIVSPSGATNESIDDDDDFLE